MHFSTGTLTALALGLVAVDAHMLMDSPVPMNKDNLDNGPLAADGSDYPCKQRPGVYDDDGANAPMALGSTQQLSFTGSAVHGGGSCQISISYDLEPTADSDFRVIHSIVGGCPAAVDGNLPENPNGNGASTFDFQIPADLPTGKATLAWTWFNRIGNREMYMNCARVVIGGGGGGGGGGGADASAKLRRRESRPILRRDQSAFEALPVMFKANINNGCTTVESTDLEFPDPGASVERAGSGSTGPPTGSCAAGSTGPTPPTSGGNGGGGGGGGDDSSQPAPSSASSSASAAVPTNTGGSFNEVPVSSPLSSPTPAAPVPATPDNEAPPPPPAASSSSSPSPSPSPSPSSSPDAPSSNSTEAQSGSCTPEGQFTCVGADSFQQCGSGRWSPVMPMAAGTVCETQALGIKVARSSTKAKRHLRFSHGHLRHHDSV
ncbi:MAG: hypothetical protein M1815_005622 [Lichina confinis]|nr:MAG: hypothetical protein M1815_005622 [Lichina confinis]